MAQFDMGRGAALVLSPPGSLVRDDYCTVFSWRFGSCVGIELESFAPDLFNRAKRFSTASNSPPDYVP